MKTFKIEIADRIYGDILSTTTLKTDEKGAFVQARALLEGWKEEGDSFFKYRSQTSPLTTCVGIASGGEMVDFIAMVTPV